MAPVVGQAARRKQVQIDHAVTVAPVPDRSGPEQGAKLRPIDTPTRLLRLLLLLPSRPSWRADELAAETGVTERTVRRDVGRLRQLGYPVVGTTGPYGGYTLGAGGRLPPLVLDDDEAVATAIGLRATAGGRLGTASAALSVLTKLDQVLPVRLREQVAALATATVGLRPPGVPEIDVDTLVAVALACRRAERLRFTYTDAQDRVSDRVAEPYRAVYTDRSWYLVAFDRDRRDWRTFRIDRMADVELTGVPFTPVDDPPDAPALVSRGIAVASYTNQARVRLHVPLDAAARYFPRDIAVLHPETDTTTIAEIGGDADWIAHYLAGLECGYEVLEPDEVRNELRALGRRLVRENRD